MYIKILLNGPEESEYQYAAELINDGYANGKVLESSLGAKLPIANLIWRGPTTLGREYLDQLQDKVRKQKWSYRILMGLYSFSLWLIGLLTPMFIQWANNT